MSDWAEFDTIVNGVETDVRSRLDDARRRSKDAGDVQSEVDRLEALLAGDTAAGEPDQLGRLVRGIRILIPQINTDVGRSHSGPAFTLEGFLDRGQELDHYKLENGTVLNGRFTFTDFLEAVADSNGTFEGLRADEMREAGDTIQSWFDNHESLDTAQAVLDKAAADVEIQDLEPIYDGLRSDDPGTQISALQQASSSAVAELQSLPEPGVATASTQAQMAAIGAASTPPPGLGTVTHTPSERAVRGRPGRTESASMRTVAGVPTGAEAELDLIHNRANRNDPAPMPGSRLDGDGIPQFHRAQAEGIQFNANQQRIADLEAELASLQNGGGGGGGGRRLSAAEQVDADRNQIHAMLAEQFGGFAFFLQQNESQLNVGLTADGTIVAADDPNAQTVQSVLDVIVNKGIVAPQRVLGILQKTGWWQNTDNRMRQFDAQFGELSDPGKQEYLEPVLDVLDKEAQFLGFELDPARAFDLAKTIARQGEESDIEFIRSMLAAEQQFNGVTTELSGFGAARDEVQSLARQYFVPIGDEAAAQFAEDVYVGDMTSDELKQYFKEQAMARFPALGDAVASGAVTPEQYFAPYKYQIEQMLDRPNVDLLDEFSDVIEYIPDGAGDGTAPRPMTLSEVRTFVRGTDEWQRSSQGQDKARSLAFAIGQTFGESA